MSVRDKTPTLEKVRIVTDPAWADEVTEVAGLVEVYSKKVRSGQDFEEELADAKARHKALLAEIDDHTEIYRFAPIGDEAYDALVSEHPPTDEQKRENEREAKAAGKDPQPLHWNTDTFPPAIIAAAAVDPRIPLEDAEWLWAGPPEWNSDERHALFYAAMNAQVRRKRV